MYQESLSPGITKEQRLEVEGLVMKEEVSQQPVDDYFLFISGDKNLIAASMERHWPEGRGIFHNKEKTFLNWVNEENHQRIISM